jgi:RHS repeat-associated protein
MKKIAVFFIFQLMLLCTIAQNIPTAATAPAPATARPLPYNLDPSPFYMRSLTPIVPVQNAAQLSISTTADSLLAATQYFDELHRPMQTVVKQASPNKKDYVSVAAFDEFNRQKISYMPYVATTNDGQYKTLAFAADSAFYKNLYPGEQVIYGQNIYDGTPYNGITKTLAPGNSWGGAGVGASYSTRANTTADSVVLFTINIVTEDDVPVKTALYLPGTLMVQEITDEKGTKAVIYTDQFGRKILTKSQVAGTPATGHSGWLCTYNVYDEMNHLRLVIPPKAVEALNNATANFNLTTNATINTGLCYAYWYDNRGRVIMKRIPGSGKSYIAYDMYDRVVMTQDPNLTTTSQWAFVLYDAQSRPTQTGIITSALIKDSVTAQAARSYSYPILTGTYTIFTQSYYDNYNWAGGTPISAAFNNVVNSTDFVTNYNAAPLYAQPLTPSTNIRGRATGSKKLLLGTSTYLYNAVTYNSDGQVIQTKQQNYSGGVDVATVQYSYRGQVLRTLLNHQKNGTNAQTHTLATAYTYDHAGRLLTTAKNIDNTGSRIISQHTYNELGQVTTKQLGAATASQTYAYNIRGWLTAINKDFVENGAGATAFFGETLAYDFGFTSTQLNGTVAGIKWKAAGDGVQRAYGFSYDKANRLTAAEFSQQNPYPASSTFTNDKVDYSVNNLTYDANSNILTMKQRGLQLNSSVTIDSLTYQYFASSNRLQKVTDGITNAAPLGDFKDTALVADDYTYDVNGNTNKDNNRHMHTAANGAGAVYNLLNRPDSIIINGKTSTRYYYDAAGNQLSKRITTYGTVTVSKTYQYLGGFVYLNDTLQYAMHSEGKIRWAKKVNSQTGVVYYAYEYDYFLKDHLGNIRAIVTEGKDTATYAATMEPASQAVETQLFANITSPVNTLLAKPAGFDADAANQWVARLNGNTATNKKTGPGITLKVMAGDVLQINTYAFYNTPTQAPLAGVNILADILGNLPNGVINNSGGKAVLANLTTVSNALSPNVTNFLNNNRPYDAARPKAFLNWILFDNQFNYVAGNSGVQQVQPGSSKQALVAPLQTIAKSGYLYVYVSNESPQDVFFDNLTVKHITGPLVQEQSYYPFGLQMAAISDKALLKTTTAEKFNAGNELEEGIEYYNTFYRKYDAQIGRFTGIDMLAESFAGITPYQFGNNNPVSNNDPMGDKWTDQNGNSHAGPNPFAFSGYAGGQALWEEGGMGFGGGGGGGGGGQYGTFWQSLWNKVSENGGGYFSDFNSNPGNRNGNAGTWFTYSYSLNNGQYGGFGNMSTMGEVVMGNTFVRDVKGVRDNGGGGKRSNDREFPAFETLWLNYPHDIVEGEHQHPSSNPKYGNQCAIRMSDCLIKSGVLLTNYPKNDLDEDNQKWALTANRLKYYLSQNFKGVEKMTQAKFEEEYWDKTGIIYLKPPPGGVGHIDLFNKGETGSGYYEASQIWFWEIK